MTEYEIADLLNGVNSNIMAGQAIFMTTLSVGALVFMWQVRRSKTE
jgi:hypothetical protein